LPAITGLSPWKSGLENGWVIDMIQNNEKNAGADFWNANPCGGSWSRYRDFLEWIRVTEPYIFDVLDRYTWDGKRVLEIGCGQGTTLNYLPPFGARMVGLDMSFQSLRYSLAGAEELGHTHSIDVMQSDAESLPFVVESFDAVLSIGVLHHTNDTRGGVREIQRVLKTDGLAIIMLYRSGNPKWWLTRFLRTSGRIIDRLMGRSFVINSLRKRQKADSEGGTALLELFGVPILKAFSNWQTREMFAGFREVRVINYQPGFRRLPDILPILRMWAPFFDWLDRVTCDLWGFYQVVEARK
jgi:SAM-dependent methyltransferase